MYELNEGFKDHLKKNWKKYAVGAAVAGTAVGAVKYKKHMDKLDAEEEAKYKASEEKRANAEEERAKLKEERAIKNAAWKQSIVERKEREEAERNTPERVLKRERYAKEDKLKAEIKVLLAKKNKARDEDKNTEWHNRNMAKLNKELAELKK